MAYKFTAARRAALARAQKRSAQLRRKGAGKNGSRNFYGKGRKGRKAARKATYGDKRHGLSISQQRRRKTRSNKWKRRGRTAMTGAVAAAVVYKNNPNVQKSVKKAAKRAKQYARNASRVKG